MSGTAAGPKRPLGAPVVIGGMLGGAHHLLVVRTSGAPDANGAIRTTSPSDPSTVDRSSTDIGKAGASVWEAVCRITGDA